MEERKTPNIKEELEEERFERIGNIKDIIWFLQGYITAKGEDKSNGFCEDHIHTLKFTLWLINDYYRKRKEG